MIRTHKRCRKCERRRRVDLFYRDACSPDGLRATCIECYRGWLLGRKRPLLKTRRRSGIAVPGFSNERVRLQIAAVITYLAGRLAEVKFLNKKFEAWKIQNYILSLKRVSDAFRIDIPTKQKQPNEPSEPPIKPPVRPDEPS